jgi:hypothetical protein
MKLDLLLFHGVCLYEKDNTKLKTVGSRHKETLVEVVDFIILSIRTEIFRPTNDYAKYVGQDVRQIQYKQTMLSFIHSFIIQVRYLDVYYTTLSD